LCRGRLPQRQCNQNLRGEPDDQPGRRFKCVLGDSSGWCAMCQLFFCLHTLVRRRPGGLGGSDYVNRYVMPSPLLTISSAEEFRARWFSTTIYDSLYDWTMRLILASVYALALFGNLSAITPIIAKAKHQPFFSTVLNMAAVGSSALFVALAAATIL